jgi:DNA-binding response OmpR family regulator
MKARILVVEDDPHILLGLKEVLTSEEYEVLVCDRGNKAVEEVQKQKPDLLLLDVMLPGLSGFEICRALRESRNNVPILMLTAKGQEIDKVVGLELGADDYVTKPFGVRELLARILALLRRTRSDLAQRSSTEEFMIGKAVIDPKRFEIRRGKVVNELSARELNVLRLFHDHPGEVLSRDHLLSQVWGYHYYGTTRTLDQCIVQLRKKLGDVGHQPRHLLTVHGVGYRLVL